MAISDWRVPSKLVRIAPLQKTRGYHTRNFTISKAVPPATNYNGDVRHIQRERGGLIYDQ